MTTIGRWTMRRGAAVLVTPSAMAKTIGVYFIIGGAAGGALTLLMDSPDAAGRLPYAGVCVSSAVVGSGLILLARHVAPSWHNWLAVVAITMVTIGITVIPDDRAAITVGALYSLMACDAAFFLPYRWAAFHSIVAATCAVVALGLRAPDCPGGPVWYRAASRSRSPSSLRCWFSSRATPT